MDNTVTTLCRCLDMNDLTPVPLEIETSLNSSSVFYSVEVVNNLMNGDIIEDLIDNDDTILPGPELGDKGLTCFGS